MTNKYRGPDHGYFETKLYKKYIENLLELMRFHRITDYNKIKTEIILPGGSRAELGTGLGRKREGDKGGVLRATLLMK